MLENEEFSLMPEENELLLASEDKDALLPPEEENFLLELEEELRKQPESSVQLLAPGPGAVTQVLPKHSRCEIVPHPSDTEHSSLPSPGTSSQESSTQARCVQFALTQQSLSSEQALAPSPEISTQD